MTKCFTIKYNTIILYNRTLITNETNDVTATNYYSINNKNINRHPFLLLFQPAFLEC